jgi:hypothetical protein
MKIHALIVGTLLIPVWTLSSPRALAATTPANSAQGVETAEETQEQALAQGDSRPYMFSLTSFLTGPPLSNPVSNETVAYIEGNTLGLSLENQLGLVWFAADNLTVTPVFDFEYQFTDPHRGGDAKGLSLTYDSFLRVYRSDLVRTPVGPHAFTIDVEGRAFVPTSQYSRGNGTLGGARLAVNPGFEVANSPFSFFVVTFARYWFQTQALESRSAAGNAVSLQTRDRGLPQWQFYMGPQVNYRVSPTMRAWFLVETSRTLDTLGYTNTSDPRASLTDIEPGVDLHLTRSLTLSPYLNWFIQQPISTMSFNMTANFTL